VKLPKGLKAVIKRTHGKRMVRHVSVNGAKLRSSTVSHGALVITLRKASRRASVRLGRGALSETHALAAKVRRKHVKSLQLTVVVRNAKGRRTTLHAKAKT
jgi:hypothetical protein